MGIWLRIVEVLLASAAGFVVGYFIKRHRIDRDVSALEEKAEAELDEARRRAMELELEARDKALKIAEDAEQEAKERARELNRQESRLQNRREHLERRLENLENRQRRLKEREQQIDARQRKLDQAEQEHLAELERISALSREQAKELLLERVEAEARFEAARIIRETEANARDEGNRRAREIITTAIQRVAADQVTDITVSTVDLPNDEMKGRIIGRGGRNIRTFESITGVDLVIDDTPDTVLLSSFDPVRREVARMALERLVLDGRIHPGRIEEMVERAHSAVEEIIREQGEQAVLDLGVHGVPSHIVELLGRLHYRTSYGQNALQHSTETAMLAALMAAELGADVELAKLAGLLHDIGKAVDHEVDGPHALIGAEIAERQGLPERVVNAIGSHHAEMEQATLEAVLVQAADAISSARPGARRESLENYIKRIRALEKLASSFDGVNSSYAIQAGREVRIMVKPSEIDDAAAARLSHDVARKVEESLQYPGQIKVTVIRETRATEFAK